MAPTSFSTHLVTAHLFTAHLVTAHLVTAHLVSAHLVSAHLASPRQKSWVDVGLPVPFLSSFLYRIHERNKMNTLFDFSIAVIKFFVWLVLTLVGGLIASLLAGFLVGVVCEQVFQISLHTYGAGGHPQFNNFASLLFLFCLVWGFGMVGSVCWKFFFGRGY